MTLDVNMALEREEPTATIATVSVKLPPFWPADPQVWFAQVEAQFTTKGITVQRTKFDHVVASLAPEYATEVRDLILTPPDANPYDTLKQQLMLRTAVSEQRRLQQLFTTEELGDRKPTQLLRQMQQLLGDKAGAMDSSFLHGLFPQHLPTNVRMVLCCFLLHFSIMNLLPTLFLLAADDSTLAMSMIQGFAYLFYPLVGLMADICFTRYKTIKVSIILQLVTSALLMVAAHQTGEVVPATARVDDQPAPLPQQNRLFVGTMPVLEPMHTSADNPALREMSWPATSSDERRWPTTQLPLLRHGPQHSLRFLVDTGAKVSYLPPTPNGSIDRMI